jgi:hypothetical protein
MLSAIWKIVRIFRGSKICQLGEFINFDVAIVDQTISTFYE